VTLDIDVSIVSDAGAQLGEGPVWDDRCRELVWVDIEAGLVHRLDVERSTTLTLDLGQPVGVAVPRRDGGLAVAVADGFALLPAGAARPSAVVIVDDRRNTRMNDGACDAAGRFWAGTLTYDRRATAALYRWDGDYPPVLVLDGVTTSNGIGWTPDGRAMLYVDTATGALDVLPFDIDTGQVGKRRRLAEIDPADGRPDGLTVDAEGGIWLALWGGSAIHRYLPDGRLDRKLQLPVSQVTSCCFGGDDLATLFVTSAARGVRERSAGAVFACRPGCVGLASHRFRR
jgi:sugar lactone lactonase YvrE